MTTPTQNLLEWIDERIAFHSKEYPKNKPLTILNRLIELDIFRARILQEVENEKVVIVDAYDTGVRDSYHKREVHPNQYYQTTFNPNNDERKQ